MIYLRLHQARNEKIDRGASRRKQFLQAILAKIIESIQTRRIRVELIVADQILEGKKSKK